MHRNFRVVSSWDGSREIKDLDARMSNNRITQYKGRGSKHHMQQKSIRRLLDEDVSMGDGVNSAGGSKSWNRPGITKKTNEPKWHKVEVRLIRDIDKNIVMDALRNSLGGLFEPFQIQLYGKNLNFRINDSKQAFRLKDLRNRITLPDGQKPNIRVSPCDRPQSKVTPEVIDKIKEVMSKRYDASTFSLDLSNFCEDSDLIQNDVFVKLSHNKVAEAILNTIGEHIPQLKSLNLSENGLTSLYLFSTLATKAPKIISLDLSFNKMKGIKDLQLLKKLKLEQISLRGNDMLRGFEDGTAYKRYMRKQFPTLMKLDTEVLPAPVKFSIGTSELPASKGSHFGTDNVKGVICLFIQQYFTVYDTKDRSGLENAYHPNATYSISSCKLRDQKDSGPPLSNYFSFSRNLTNIPHDSVFAKLHSPRSEVIKILNKLPETVHIPDSLVVDVSHISASMVIFNVKGIFKEVSGNHLNKLAMRQFNRTIVAVPNFEGIAIMNEMVHVTNVSTSLYLKYLEAQKKPEPLLPELPPQTIVVAPEMVLTPLQQNEMVALFSQQSGMNAQFSQLCLAENDWNYEKAGTRFTALQAAGAIPPEAFIK